MGILRVGEKRAEKGNGYTKVFKVRRIGWRRIAKNISRLGWHYLDEKGGSDIKLPPDKCGKHKVWLTFWRLDSERDAQPAAVRTLEFFYNLIFLVRRIAAFFLPVLLVAGIIVSIIKQPDGFSTAVAFILSCFAIWIACIILEGVLARCADAKLKVKTDVIKPTNNQQNSSNKKYVGSSSSVQDEDDDVVTLTTAKGEELDFVEVAGINYKDNFYAIMQPVELLDGMEEDEALVFRVYRSPEGEDKFEVELDDNVIDAVFVEYNKLLDEAEKNNWKSPE